jgi:leucyl aminopeptidase
MEVDVALTVKQGDIGTAGGPAVAVNLYQGVTRPGGAAKAVDEASGGMISRALAAGDFKGSLGETLVLYPGAGEGPERIVLLGLGDGKDFDTEAARVAAGSLAGVLRKLKVTSAATVVHGGDSGHPVREMARALAEGLLMGLYRYHNYFRDDRGEALALKTVTVVERLRSRIGGIEAGVAMGTNVARAVNHARELGNGPSNEVTPSRIAESARRLGRTYGFKVTVMDADQCAKAGMGAFLGVAKGSDEPCRFIVMDYAGAKPKGTVCFVGKGITFDSGGISIKPAQDMDQMKFDMGGSAAVIGALQYAASQKVPLRVVGIIASTENMPGGHAIKPGDILTSAAGVTIEVLNTDAEGRLVLADALDYAKRYQPDAVVDLATLTGACVIALAGHAAGLMGNDEWLLDRVYEAGRASGDRAWPLPLWSEYRKMVQSDVADIKNTAGRGGGAITAGAFLGAFTNTYRWVHLDIAGVAWNDTTRSYNSGSGGTGAGVRILAEFMNRWKRPAGSGPKPGPRTSLGPVPKGRAAAGGGETARNAMGAKTAGKRKTGAGKTRAASGKKRRR